MIFLRSLMFKNIMLAVLNILLLVLIYVTVDTNKKIGEVNEDPMIIASDEYGLRVIPNDRDHLKKIHQVKFIQKFITSCGNLNHEDVGQSIDLCTNLMSEELWKSSEVKITELQKTFSIEHNKQKVDILEIKKDRESERFVVIADVTLTTRSSKKSIKIEYSLELIDSKITENNPWGLEVNYASDRRI